MVNTKRNSAIDIAKGIAISLMLFDHIYGQGSFITSFHMPLFFVMSGYFFREEDGLLIVIQKKARTILLPYLVIGLVYLVVQLLLLVQCGQGGEIMPFLQEGILEILTGRSNNVTWFLMALFVTSVLYATIWKISRNCKWLYAVLIISLSSLGYVLGRPMTMRLYQVDVALLALIFFGAGHISRKLSGGLKPWVTYGLLIVCLVVWFIGIINGGIVLALRIYPYYPYCILSALAGTYCVVKFSGVIDRIPGVRRVLAFLGRESLKVLCLGGLFINVLGLSAFGNLGWSFVLFVGQLIVVMLVLWGWAFVEGKIEDAK